MPGEMIRHRPRSHSVLLLANFATLDLPATISLLFGGHFDLLHVWTLGGIGRLVAGMGRVNRVREDNKINGFREACSSFSFIFLVHFSRSFL